jgi:integrase
MLPDYIRETTKSGRARAVNIDDETSAALRRWKARQAEERLAFGPAYNTDGRIVAEADGSLVQPDTLSARLKRLERLAGVRSIGLHGARHTHATLALAAGGARLDIVSRQLGHASIASTADVYGHPDDEAAAEAAQDRRQDPRLARGEILGKQEPRRVDHLPGLVCVFAGSWRVGGPTSTKCHPEWRLRSWLGQ